MTLVAASARYDAVDLLLDQCNLLGIADTLEGKRLIGVALYRFSVELDGHVFRVSAATREDAAHKLWLELMG